MASIGDTTRPAFAYDQATDTWVPVGIGPHSHTAANVGAVATSSFAAKGDLLVGTGAGTLVAQTVGANGTVLTADSAEADGVKWAAPSSGAVVQVKSATTSTSASTTTGTPIDTNLSVSITPTSASNRILVFITQQMAAESSAATPEPATVLQLVRNSTVIWNGGGQYGFYFFKNASGRTELRHIVNASFSDNPATTSAITYKTQFGTGASNVTATVQAMSSTSTITVMEVTP